MIQHAGFSYAHVIVVLFLGLSRFGYSQDDLRNLAVSEVVKYQSTSELDLGDFYLASECRINSLPNSPDFFETEVQFEKLVIRSRKTEGQKIEWHRVLKSSESSSGERRSALESECSSERLLKGKQLYVKLSTGKWVPTTEEKSKTNCYFHNVFDWPFLTYGTLVEDQPNKDFPFHTRECVHAERTEKGLVAVWETPKGKGVSRTYTTFLDGVPVSFRVDGFLGPMGDKKTDLSKKRVLAKVDTSWKKFRDKKLPVKVNAVIDEGPNTVLVEAKFDWKLDKDIPDRLIEELDAIESESP
jgi:hypothetical protein